MKWITREHIKVDRVACPWLIRRFIDPQAQFLFVDESQLLETAAREDAIPFDAPRLSEVKLNHRGVRCSFEAIIEDYHLQAPGLERLALIVRAADIKGQEQIAVEGIGLRAMAEGFAALGLSDEERLVRQFPVYDALYEYARHSTVKVPVSKDLFIINTAAFLRSFTFGLTGVVLGIYLFRAGLSSFNIGMVVAVGLVGSALATIGVTAKADRAGRRRTLVALSLLGSIGALALAFTPAVPVLLAMAFVGMLNGTGTDRSAAFSLEQAIIPGLVPDASRTWGLAWYNVVLDAAGSLGALAAALPLLLQRWLALPLLASYRMVFLGCAFLGVVGAILYSSAPLESRSPNQRRRLSLITSHQQPKRSSQNLQVCFPWMPSAADF